MVNRYFCIDLETTVRGGPDGGSPEAHWLNNEVLLCGYQLNNGCTFINRTVDTVCDIIQLYLNDGDSVWVIAHNAKFDLKYLMRDRPDVEWHKVKVWDTMTWEYRQSGHFSKFMSLEDACVVHSVPFKKTLDLGALLDSGVKMEDIDRELLKDYLREDVRALSELFNKQSAINVAWDMDYILPLAEMELNGMCVDMKQAAKLYTTLAARVDKIEAHFMNTIMDRCEWMDGTPIIIDDFSDQVGTKSKCIKPTAARTLSFLLTENPVVLKVTPKWGVVFKDTDHPVYDPTNLPACFKNPTNLGYPLGEDILVQLSDTWSEMTLAHRGANKLLSTYMSPFLYTGNVQGTIHPKLNTTVTNTGRLSSSAPNGQNVPPKARALIKPHNAKDSIIELDFSQLEMVAVACVSECPDLLRDLQDGVDIHYRSGKSVYGWNTPSQMTKDERKIVKNVNFGLLYGGKAGGLSKQTGVDRKIVQKLIDSFYKAYPRVAKWQEEVFEDVCDTMFAHHISDTGEQVYASMYDEPFSGRRFKFVEQKSPPWLRRKTGRGFSFSPQQTSNYPIQGFAGGDIVMFALTALWRQLRHEVKFIMTVHDSIILEGDHVPTVDVAMLNACKETVAQFNLPVDLSYDIEIGDHWS